MCCVEVGFIFTLSANVLLCKKLRISYSVVPTEWSHLPQGQRITCLASWTLENAYSNFLWNMYSKGTGFKEISYTFQFIEAQYHVQNYLFWYVITEVIQFLQDSNVSLLLGTIFLLNATLYETCVFCCLDCTIYHCAVCKLSFLL